MALVGNLKELNIATLVQLNCVEKNTAQLTVNTRKGPATIYFGKGEVIDASLFGERGEDALYRILSLAEGEFRVAPVTDLPQRTIFTPWESLLLEGMRVIDETEKGKTKIAQSVGNELDSHPQVKSYVIASKKGEVIATNGANEGEKLAAAAALLARKGQEVSSRMALGEMSLATLLTENSLTFFMECGGLVATIVAKKPSVSGALRALADSVRKRLKSCNPAVAQQGAETSR